MQRHQKRSAANNSPNSALLGRAQGGFQDWPRLRSARPDCVRDIFGHGEGYAMGAADQHAARWPEAVTSSAIIAIRRLDRAIQLHAPDYHTAAAVKPNQELSSGNAAAVRITGQEPPPLAHQTISDARGGQNLRSAIAATMAILVWRIFFAKFHLVKMSGSSRSLLKNDARPLSYFGHIFAQSRRSSSALPFILAATRPALLTDKFPPPPQTRAG